MTEAKKSSLETGLEIAVIGMSGKFPGARDLDRFWENLENGVESISTFTSEELRESGVDERLLENPNYVKAHGAMEDRAYFDASFFGYSPKEAESMDPMIRLFHECAWEALENAGYDPTSYKGAIGLYAGASDGFEWKIVNTLKNMGDPSNENSMHLTENGLLLSAWISYKLNLRGPSITLFTACSTGLVAIHTASRALLTGECAIALAGAGSVLAQEKTGYMYQEGMILSSDGHCRPFDLKADGTVYGEGVGVVVLKRLKQAEAEGDHIRAIIKASAINNDGTGKASFTAPGKQRIIDVIRTVLKLSRVEPETVGYIEAHGTATPLGDGIEIGALKEAFNIPQMGRCGLGSIKSNIGHLDVAAGIAGFIKTILALECRFIPPTLHFETPNPTMDLINSPFYINSELSSWESPGPLRAGICSFGVGGTNAFMIVESAAPVVDNRRVEGPYLLMLSARTGGALEKITQNLVEFLKMNPRVNLGDVAYTLQVGRKVFNRKRMALCSSVDEAIHALSTPDPGKEPDEETVKLYETGWSHPNFSPRRIPLPTYPFERQYYWIDIDPMSLSLKKESGRSPVWVVVVDERNMGAQITERLKQNGKEVVVVRAGSSDSFSKNPEGEYLLNPAQDNHYDALFKELEKLGNVSANVSDGEGKEGTGLYQRPQLSTEYVAPRDDVENAVAGVWRKFFGIKEIGIHDDFFELGGDSLKAITVVTDLHRELNVRVPISEFFQSTTISKLVKTIKSVSAGDEYSNIEPVEEREYYPLSSVQRRIYILHQMDVNSTGYNTPLIFDIEGKLDIDRLNYAFRAIVERHESLRTSYISIDGEPAQRIHNDLEFEIKYFNLATEDTEDTEGTLAKVFGPTFLQKGRPSETIINAFIRPFDLSKASLLRVGLIKVGEERYVLMTDMDHIATDGTSIGVLFNEFAMLYSGRELAPLRIQYKDYAQWQRSEKQRNVIKRQEVYWLQQFAGEIPALHLPIDYARPVIQSFEGSTRIFEIHGEEVGVLKRIAFKEDATLFMVLLTIFNIFLSKLSNQEDIVVGTPIAGRTHADLRGMIGMLVNTLALRNKLSGEQTFREFLRAVRDNTLGAFENQDYLFEDLVENVSLNVNRDVSRNPVFDVMLGMRNFRSQYDSNLAIDIPGLILKERDEERKTSIFDITLQAAELDEGLWFIIEYCVKLFKHETIERFIEYFRRILSFVALSPDMKISQIEIISEEERSRIMLEFNSLEFVGAPGKSICELFEEQVNKAPDHIAVSFQSMQMTYRELDEKTGRLASWLRSQGAGPDVIVGIMLERSVEMVIGLLGVMKAGAAGLPIDVEYPQERIDFMLKDSNARILLNDELLMNPSVSSVTSVAKFFLPATSVAYIIYTSGSTGKPKGSMLEYRTLDNLISHQFQYTDIDFSRVLQFTSIGFDVSYQEIFSTLAAGGSLFLISRETVTNISRLFRVIDKNDIKTLFLPASFLKFVFNEKEYANRFPGCVDHIVTAGEQAIVTDSFRDYLKANHVYLHNHYGPSETHVVTALTLTPDDAIPALPSIGKPIANTCIYIMDKANHIQAVGIPGELFIGGVQVGRGYLNNPEKTAEQFCLRRPIPLLKKGAWTTQNFLFYKTGDLARWLDDGNIEFLGRIDQQVKIRGFRVEPGEIETCLLNHPQIKEAVVTVREDKGKGKYLCAYIVSEIEISVGELRGFLSGKLPNYMTPSYFVSMEKFPITSNGKVDRRSLPAPKLEAAEDYTAPRDMVEIKLTELWAEALDIKKSIIGIDSDFFQLGGHSLKATALISRIHMGLNVEITLGEMFRNPTIRRLADHIKSAETNIYTSIEPVEKMEYYPVSSAQKRMYILQQMDLESTAYHMPQVIRLEGNIDIDRLEQIFLRLIQRHDVFRTSFLMVNEDVAQQVHDKVEFKIEFLVTEDTEDTEKKIHRFIHPFELSKAPLIRVELARFEEKKSVLLVDVHHIISDGASTSILTAEFMALYRGEGLPGLRIQYKDYAVWQSGEVIKMKMKRQEEYWLDEFSGEIPVLNLPYDGPRPAIQDFEGRNFSFEIGEEDTAALNRLALEEGVTLFMVLEAFYTILLSKLGGQDDIVIGVPTAGRNHPDLEILIGMFVNTLALRNYPIAGKHLKEYLQEVKERTLSAFANQDYQFEDLVERVAVTRNAGRSPLFDVMLGLQNLKHRVEDIIEEPERRDDGENYDMGVSRFDMTWNAIEKGGRVWFDCEYSTQLFKQETMERFVDYFKQVVAFVVSLDERDLNRVKLSEIEIIPVEEKRRVLFEFNRTAIEYPQNKTIHELFRGQAEKTPDIIALIGLSIRAIHESPLHITYGELNEQSDRIAFLLIEKGIEPGVIVGIKMERSIEMIIGIFGILKSGAAYLPIDPNYPQERIDYILKDSGAKFLLDCELSIVNCELLMNPSVSSVTSVAKFFLPATSVAYVIYTSGSTGRPKGVMIEHKSVVNLLFALQSEYPFDVSDVYLLKTSYVFDVSVVELFGWYMGGGRAAILEKDGHKDPRVIVESIKRNKVSHINFVPSMFNAFIEYMKGKDTSRLSSLKYIFLAGEALLPKQVEKFTDLNIAITLENIYGPTESTVYASKYSLSDWKGIGSIPIGKPLPNIELYIFDKNNYLQPVGVPGELYIGGDGVASGYLNNPERTAETFINQGLFLKKPPLDPAKTFVNTNTLYKTGDLARWLSDGNIEYLGRIDHQVKIRGFRIELGEIENRLAHYPGVKEVVVIVKELKDGDKYLCAYIVSEIEISAPGLRGFLSGALPEYMIPTYFVRLEKMPLNANGKLDIKSLPAPEIGDSEPDSGPKDRIEEKLVSLYSNILSIERSIIRRSANFFELGGHSLKAIVLIGRIHKEFDTQVSLAEVFKTPTIAGIAELIRGNETTTEAYIPIEQVETKEYYKLSSAQMRMYLLQRMNPESTVYNIPQEIVLDVSSGFEMDIKKLEETFKQLIQRHESFRTSFEVIEGEPIQRVHDEVEFKIQLFNLATEDTEKGLRPFDLKKAPLMRVGLAQLEETKYLLLVDMSHIISDGVSMRILTEEFMMLYRGEELPELLLQYKDYAYWQNSELSKSRMKSQEEYWLNRFSGEIPVLNLPYDFPRPVVQGFEGSAYSFSIEEEETAALNRLVSDHGVTLFIILETLFTLLLSKLSGQDDIVIGTPTAGRNHADLETIIGMFVNTLALRNYPTANKTLNEYLQEVKERTLSAFANQDYQFEDLVERVDVVRDISRNPLFDVMLSLQNMGNPVGDYNDETKVSRFDMTWTVFERSGRLWFNVEYSTALFKKETIERFVDYFKQVVMSVVSLDESNLLSVELSEIEIISLEEKRRVLFEFNRLETGYCRDKTIHELFRGQAEKTPDIIALIGLSIRAIHESPLHITYGELNEQADILAHELIEKGIEPGDIVGIMIERSIEMIVGIVGILKTGAAYLPLNPKNPKERTDFMLQDSNAKILSNTVGDRHACPSRPLNFSTSQLVISVSSVAYVIYTSGSTGNPKGVPITHANISPLLHWGYKNLGLTSDDRSAQNLSYYFDWSVWEIFIALTSGSSLYMVSDEIIMDSDTYIDFIDRNRITVLHITPTHFQSLISPGRKLNTLRHLCIGAEKLTYDLVKRSFEIVDEACRVYNMYGPTEATIMAAVLEIERSNYTNYKELTSVPIGKAVGNTALFVLDKHRGICPINIPGELYIGGDGVASGYLNNQVLTNEKFLPFCKKVGPKTFAKGLTLNTNTNTLYKTGDFARWISDRNIEYLGRIDRQVKIRGFRIDPGKIENRLMGYPGVRNAVAIVKELSDGDKYLCAYIVSEKEFSIKKIREFLSGILPDYMIPTYFMRIERMPLNANGKMDIQSLPAPGIRDRELYTGPKDWIEEKLVSLYSDVLSIEGRMIRRSSNFFELGGHSLKATILIGRIHKDFAVELSLSEVFKTPTIAGIAELIRGNVTSTEEYIPIEPVETKEYYKLSSAQKRMYLLQQMDLESTVYNIPQEIILDASIGFEMDIKKLEETFKQLIQRHESFRTSFEVIEGEPVQRVHNDVKFQIELFNLATEDTEDTEKGLRPFDLKKAPLMRVGMAQLEETKYLLLVDMSHIISDGVSMGILTKEFMKLYRGEELPGLRLQYKDYAHWQNREISKTKMKRQEEYWINELSGEIPVLNLPTDYTRPIAQSFEGSVYHFRIEENETALLKRFVLEQGVTLFMMLEALFTLLLSKLSRQEDIVIGVPTAGRNHADLENLIGMFVNTLVLRNNPAANKTLNEYVQEVKERTLTAFANQDYQFEDIVDRVGVVRDIGRNPLFDVMMTLQDMGTEMDAGREESGREEDESNDENKISRFDMTWTAVEQAGGLRFYVEYSIKLFKKETIERYADCFKQVVETVVLLEESELRRIKLSGIEIISSEDRRRVLVDFNRTEADYPRNKTIHELFEEQVERTPDNIALVGPVVGAAPCCPVCITYRELDEKTGRLSSALRSQGAGPDVIVGIKLERTVEMVIGIMGILKAGAAYMPIESSYPQERIDYMLKDSGAKILLNDELSIVNCELLINPSVSSVAKNLLSAASAAYVIYTSGSTGRPKGVMVEHRSLVNLCYWHNANYSITSQDRAAKYAGLGFDASVLEIFPYLIKGVSLNIVPEEIILDMEALNAYYETNRITIGLLPTQVCEQFMELSNTSLRILITGGDKLKKYKKRNYQLYNNYGPTENTVVTTIYSVTEEMENIPIGKPVNNNRIEIMDRSYRLQPIRVPGELYVGGESLARGYINNPELTNEMFISFVHRLHRLHGNENNNPKSKIQIPKLYRTGDLARWLEDGNIEFLGRIDQQVKIRGIRIELGEIENRLRACAGIKEVVVIDRNDKGRRYLCGYIVKEPGAGEGKRWVEELKESLEGKLPGYMIPSCFVKIERIPLNSSGKLDRKKLPQPLETDFHTGEKYEEPAAGTQSIIAETWKEVLGREKVGAHDNFFDLGGNSLDFVNIANKLKERLDMEISVLMLLTYPTISSLERHLSREQRQETTDEVGLDRSEAIEEGRNLIFQTQLRLDEED